MGKKNLLGNAILRLMKKKEDLLGWFSVLQLRDDDLN